MADDIMQADCRYYERDEHTPALLKTEHTADTLHTLWKHFLQEAVKRICQEPTPGYDINRKSG